jgi:hypothetical protein
MKTLLVGIAFAIGMLFASQAFAAELPDCPKGAWKHGHYICGDVSWRGMTILLLGMIVGVILWTPALPWLFKSLGFDWPVGIMLKVTSSN